MLNEKFLFLNTYIRKERLKLMNCLKKLEKNSRWILKTVEQKNRNHKETSKKSMIDFKKWDRGIKTKMGYFGKSNKIDKLLPSETGEEKV